MILRDALKKLHHMPEIMKNKLRYVDKFKHNLWVIICGLEKQISLAILQNET